MIRVCRILAFAALVKVNGDATALKTVEAPLNPALEPRSDKKFFRNEYPNDKAPARNNLHFTHPFPSVQDSDDFATDFVKDQNTDNGEHKAQMVYDKLRYKSSRLRRNLAHAKERKKSSENDLNDSMKEFEKEINEAKAQSAKESEDYEKEKDAYRKKYLKQEVEDQPWEWSWQWPWSWTWPWWGGGRASTDPVAPHRHALKRHAVEMQDASNEVEEAMDNMEKCKMELEVAKAEQERLTERLKRADGRRAKAEGKLDDAKKKETAGENESESLHKKYEEKTAEFTKAKAAYLKQKGEVEKVGARLKVLEAKVSLMRDREDKNGGVYPDKSDAPQQPDRNSATSSLPMLGIFSGLVITAVAF